MTWFKRTLQLLAVTMAGVLSLETAVCQPSKNPAFAPLWLYNGSFQVTRKSLAPGSKPDQLKNVCAALGIYFACQQEVNGSPGALLIFVAAKEPGHYYTQNVNGEGRAAGRGDLNINGDVWVYSSSWNQGGGKTTYYKTTNWFTGRNKIRFEQQESTNNRDWSTTESGDEVRIGTGIH